jgi:hypothetical protein
MVQTPEEEEGPVCKGSPFLIFRSYFLKIIGETLFLLLPIIFGDLENLRILEIIFWVLLDVA